MSDEVRGVPDGASRPDGGDGGELPDGVVEADDLKGDWFERTPREDAKLIGRAIAEGWDIPEAAFKELPTEVLEIAKDKTLSVRKRLSAISTLMKMHGQNQGKGDGKNINLNIGVAVQATAKETNGLTEEELNRTIDERIALLASIESKSLPSDG